MRAKRGSGAMAAHRLTRRGAADSAAISEFTAEQFNAEQACRRLGTSSADPEPTDLRTAQAATGRRSTRHSQDPSPWSRGRGLDAA